MTVVYCWQNWFSMASLFIQLGVIDVPGASIILKTDRMTMLSCRQHAQSMNNNATVVAGVGDFYS